MRAALLAGAAAALIATLVPIRATAQDAGSAAALKASYAGLRARIDQSPFGKPLHLESSEGSDRLKGDIHAAVPQPFERVRAAMQDAHGWCDAFILHPNITGCRVASGVAGQVASIVVTVSRHETPIELSFRVDK